MTAQGDYRPHAVDLSGFAKRGSAVPPPRLDIPKDDGNEEPIEAVSGPPPRRSPPRRSMTRRGRSQGEKPNQEPAGERIQFFVHLPSELNEWLREQAERRGWPKREVILDAFLQFRDGLEGHDSDTKRRREAGLPPRAPKRRKDVGGVGSNVYMVRAEAEVLDRHAESLGMSRSQLVTELLRAATAHGGADSRTRSSAKH